MALAEALFEDSPLSFTEEGRRLPLISLKAFATEPPSRPEALTVFHGEKWQCPWRRILGWWVESSGPP